jgi:hypothetical protein
MPSTVVLQYNKQTFQQISMTAAPGAGNQTIYWNLNTFTITTPPKGFSLPTAQQNNQVNITTLVATDGASTQETYIFNVSDTNNNTLGSIEYIFNYVDDGSDITNLASLQGFVFAANGIFSKYRHGTVYQTFNNNTGVRVITIQSKCN